MATSVKTRKTAKPAAKRDANGRFAKSVAKKKTGLNGTAKPVRVTAKLKATKDAEEMLSIMFKRARTTPDDILKEALPEWMDFHKDLLSPSERKKNFKKFFI